METLKGEHIYLRAIEPEDVDFMYHIENNESLWQYSLTNTPFSRALLQQYIDNSHRDIYDVKQLRLAICLKDDALLGFIDVFDFEPLHKRAGIGILIANKKDRGKGYGKEALQMLQNYCYTHLHLHQLYANISSENINSQTLFEQCGFKKVGLKKDWVFNSGNFKDEYLYQHINTYVH